MKSVIYLACALDTTIYLVCFSLEKSESFNKKTITIYLFAKYTKLTGTNLSTTMK